MNTRFYMLLVNILLIIYRIGMPCSFVQTHKQVNYEDSFKYFCYLSCQHIRDVFIIVQIYTQ